MGRVGLMVDETDFDARSVALEGARCLGRLVQDNGIFLYAYHAETREPIHEYDLIRHSAACWAIALAAKQLGGLDAEFAAAQRAMDWLIDKHTHAMGRAKCVVQGDSIFLGASALAVAALVELASDDGSADRNLEAARQYCEFILACRRPDGDFIHRIDTRQIEADPWRSNFYTGQALLALVLCSRATGDEHYLDVAREMVSAFGLKSYGVDVRSHWMSHAISQLHGSVTQDWMVDYAGRIARAIADEPIGPSPGSTGYACSAEALGAYGDMLVRTQGRTSGPRWAETMAKLKSHLAALMAFRLDDGAFLLDARTGLVQIDSIQHAVLGYLAYARLSAHELD